MTKQNKAFKFRLLPNKKQEVLLVKTFGCVRFVYNKMLTERKETYEKFKDNKEMIKEQKFPTPAKYKDEFPIPKRSGFISFGKRAASTYKMLIKTSLKAMPNFQSSKVVSQNSLTQLIE